MAMSIVIPSIVAISLVLMIVLSYDLTEKRLGKVFVVLLLTVSGYLLGGGGISGKMIFPKLIMPIGIAFGWFLAGVILVLVTAKRKDDRT